MLRKRSSSNRRKSQGVEILLRRSGLYEILHTCLDHMKKYNTPRIQWGECEVCPDEKTCPIFNKNSKEARR